MASPARPNRPTPAQPSPPPPTGAGDLPPVSAPELQGVSIPRLAAPAEGAPVMPVPQQPTGSVAAPPPAVEPAILTERDIAKQAAKYTHAGMLSADQIISGEADRYQFLQPKLLEVIAWVQQALIQSERAEDLAKARTDPSLRREISEEIDRLALSYLLKERGIRGEDGKVLIAMVINEIVGLGPLEPLWQDPDITEVICNGPQSVFVEKSGRLVAARACRFRSQEHLLEVCQRILAPLNRKVDVRDPLADGRLPDGSRVNVVHHAIAPKGPLLTIRRFPEQNRSLVDLVELGSMDQEMAALLATLIANRASTLVVGGTGSGKALDVETPIPTPQGFKRMGDIQVGDEVFDEQGRPTTVLGAYDVQHDRDCYDVIFSDGSSIVADADHLWLTYQRHEPGVSRMPRDGDGLLHAADMLQTSRAGMLATVSALAAQLPSDTTLTAGTLAALLPKREGASPAAWRDVLSAMPHVGTSDGEPLYLAGEVARAKHWGSAGEYFAPTGPTSRVLTTRQIRDSLLTPAGLPRHSIPLVSSAVQYPSRPLPIPPRALGLQLAALYAPHTSEGLNERSEADDQFEADEQLMAALSACLISSQEQRESLLSGLLDSPACSVRGSSGREFCTLSAHLARQVATLAASLGHHARVRSRTQDDAGRATVYLVGLQGRADQSHAHHEATHYREIVDIVPVVSRPVRCIRVANESHLFLAGEAYIPTHNTTLLNALSAAIPRHERVITIEDSLELRLHPESHVAAMEARPADATGSNSVSIRNLVKNALRMRPDRIIVGEIRDSAALDMLQACNTGHEGSMSTVHANGPDEALSRLTVMVAQGGEIPADKVEWLIGSALDLMVIAKRFDDGSRRVAGLYEVPNTNTLAPGEPLRTIPLWEWEQTGTTKAGKAVGRYVKRNDISEHLRKERSLDHGKIYDWDDVVSLSADISPGAKDARPKPGKPAPPRPSVSRARQEFQ